MSMLANHRASILIAAVTALLVSLASVCAYVAFEKYIRQPLQNEAYPPRMKPVAKPTQSAKAPTFVWPDTDEATNKDLNARYAELETLKLDVAVAEQAKRLDDLRNVGEVSSQKAELFVESDIPAMVKDGTLVAPELAAISSVVPQVVAMPAVTEPKLMGVYGVDGALRASFMTPEGKRIVQKGQSLLGSRVTSITLEGVSLANGKVFHVGQ